MKYLGIDYGTKRVGIAISDEEGTMAFPKTVLQNDAKLLESITELCFKEEVGAIVVGESKNFSGQNNLISPDIEKFTKNLKIKLNLPVYFEPELFSSAEAERLQGKNEMIDASAASIILKSYLDKQKNT